MKTKHITLLALGAIVLASCQNSTIPDEASQNDGVLPLEISVGAQTMTRTPIIGKLFGHGLQINVILLDKVAVAPATYNKMLTYQLDRPNSADEGTWLPAGLNDPLEVKVDVASVLAHYPASGAIALSADKRSITPSSPHSLDLGENNVSSLYESFQMSLNSATPTELTEIFSAKADVDYMTGVGNEVSTLQGATKASAITMKHAKAMVIVNVFKEEAYAGDDQLKSITITNTLPGTKPLKEGSFKLADNSFTATTPIAYHRSMSKFRGGTHFAMLVFPATLAVGDATMAFHVGVIRYTLPLPAAQWVAGRVYAYNVQLSANEVVWKGGVQVYDWPATIKLTVDLE